MNNTRDDSTPIRTAHEHEDILIGRVVDQEATAADWAALEAIATTDRALWSRLAAAQRDHDALRSAFERNAESVADTIEIPGRAAHAMDAMSIRVRAWSGWAAAAVLALAWAGAAGFGLLSGDRASSIQHAGLVSSLTPDEALDQYLTAGQAQGRVLGELPKVMIESRPLEEGQRVEVLFIRQIYERAVVTELYSHGQDDLGRAVYTPVTTPPDSASGSL